MTKHGRNGNNPCVVVYRETWQCAAGCLIILLWFCTDSVDSSKTLMGVSNVTRFGFDGNAFGAPMPCGAGSSIDVCYKSTNLLFVCVCLCCLLYADNQTQHRRRSADQPSACALASGSFQAIPLARPLRFWAGSYVRNRSIDALEERRLGHDTDTSGIGDCSGEDTPGCKCAFGATRIPAGRARRLWLAADMSR